MKKVKRVNLESLLIVGPEHKLADYWAKKSNLEWSVWDGLLGKRHDKFQSYPALLIGNIPPQKRKDIDMVRVLEDVGLRILHGFPLSYIEYHIAIAFGYLCPNKEIPYETFYKKHWVETETHFGYGARSAHQ